MEMAPIVSEGVALFERIRNSGLVGMGVVLLRGACHREWALRFQMLTPGPVSHSGFLLSLDPDVNLSAPSQTP